MSDAIDVLRSIDQLRRDLSGYHGQLKAHNDLQRHCDNQRKRIGELEGLYAEVKAENERLRKELESVGTAAYLYGRDGLRSENEKLKAENAKLRELVRAAWKCIHTGASCYDCRLIAGGCTLQTAMRELGVEVSHE